jgi:hypothetical protein
MDSQIEKAIALLKGQGHRVEPYNREGTFWFEIDRRLLASAQEMRDIADGVYSIEELEGLFQKRKDEEWSKQ